MTLTLRIVLLVMACIAGIWILRKIHKSKQKMEDVILGILSAVYYV